MESENKTVWKRVEKSSEAQELLLNLTHESLKEFVIKYIYNDKKSKRFGNM